VKLARPDTKDISTVYVEHPVYTTADETTKLSAALTADSTFKVVPSVKLQAKTTDNSKSVLATGQYNLDNQTIPLDIDLRLKGLIDTKITYSGDITRDWNADRFNISFSKQIVPNVTLGTAALKGLGQFSGLLAYSTLDQPVYPKFYLGADVNASKRSADVKSLVQINEVCTLAASLTELTHNTASKCSHAIRLDGLQGGVKYTIPASGSLPTITLASKVTLKDQQINLAPRVIIQGNSINPLYPNITIGVDYDLTNQKHTNFAVGFQMGV